MFTKVKEPGQREPVISPAQQPSAPPPRRTPRSAPSIVSADMTIVGAITAGGDIQVDGRVEGDIVTDSLTVGEKAVIKGEVLAEEVVVRGLVEGSIKAERVQLMAGARVQGDILHAALAVETGALFEGNCRHSQDPLGRKSGTPAPADSVASIETAPVEAPSKPAPPAKPEGALPRPAENKSPEAAREVPRARETEAAPVRPDLSGSPAARFKPAAPIERPTAAASDAESRRGPSSGHHDLGKINPGRMRAGAEEPGQKAGGKPK